MRRLTCRGILSPSAVVRRLQTNIAGQPANRQPARDLTVVGGLFVFCGFIMTIGIYRILNTTNGKNYVGQSVTVEYRLQQHLKQLTAGTHFNRHLQASFAKNGAGAFVFEIVCECKARHLTALESFHIWFLDSRRNGYNIRIAANSNRGVKHSAEICKKFSDRQRQRFQDPLQVEALRQRLRKYWDNPTNIEAAKRRGAQRAKEHPEIAEAIRQRMLRRFSDPAQREAARVRARRQFSDKKQVDIVRHRAVKRWQDPEQRAAASRCGLKRFEDPAQVEACRTRAVTRYADPANREVASIAAISSWSDPVRKAARVAKCRATRTANKAKNRRVIQLTLFDVDDDKETMQ